MTLEQYCKEFYLSVLSSANLPKGTEAEERAFVNSLAAELRQEYVNRGSPYGTDEEDLVRYLKERVTLEVEN